MSEELRPNLKSMLSEAKDTSEIMVDLAYAALFYLSPDIAEELDRLEKRLTELIFDMRILCLVAARSREDAEGMASVLQVVGAIEKIANAAVDIGRIVTRNLGIPAGLIRDLSQAEEVVTRARVRRNSQGCGATLRDLQLPTEFGVRVIAIRRGDDWVFDPAGPDVVSEDDVVFMQGPPDGIAAVRELFGAPPLSPPPYDPEEEFTDLGRAIDVLVEMKNISEAAVGLAYSALMFNDRSLAAEVRRLEERMDEMREQLELWTLRAAAASIDPRPLRGLLHLGVASESIGDAAVDMVWLVEENEEIHPVFALSMGESDETVIKTRVAEDSRAAGSTLGDLRVEVETGVRILAIRRKARWIYRPRGFTRLEPGDELIGVGPPEGEESLAFLVGSTATAARFD
ncbi:MAG: potassium channel protein [Acidimicrobiia bacterium]